MAGLDHQDYGVETLEAAGGIAGALLRAFRERWQWQAGIALRDWRYTVRIPNIDISNLVTKSSAADLFDLMIKALHRNQNVNAGKSAWYMNRTVHQMLEIQTRDDVQSGGGLTFDNVSGKRVSFFQQIPVRICDALLETEAAVV